MCFDVGAIVVNCVFIFLARKISYLLVSPKPSVLLSKYFSAGKRITSVI